MRTVLMMQYGYDTRALRIISQLERFGWKAIFITMGQNFYLESYDRYLKDAEVIKLPHGPVPPVALPAFFRVRKHFFIPEFYFYWVYRAIQKAKEVISRRKVDLVYTNTTYSNFLAGYHLKRKLGLPWVADYADPWTGNFVYHRPPNQLVERFDKWLEWRISSAADFITTVTPAHADYLQNEIGLDGKRIKWLPLGYLREDLENAKAIQRKKDKLTLVHLGVFYNEYSLNVLVALKKLLRTHPEMKGKVELLFVGKVFDRKLAEIRAMGMGDVVKIVDMVPFYTAMGWLKYTDVNLMLVGGKRVSTGVMTSKLPEYMMSGKPILAVVPKGGLIDEIVRDTRVGTSVGTNDIKGIERVLLDYFEEFQKKGSLEFKGDNEKIAFFDYRRIVKDLTDIFDKVS